MDLHNNEIGFAIGKLIKEQNGGFKDVLAAAQSVMERGWGKPAGAMIGLPDGTRVAIPKTMPESKWSSNPIVTSHVMIGGKKVVRKRELTNAQSNKPVGNWRAKFAPEPYSYSYGKPKAPDNPIGGSDASADAGSGDATGKSVDVAASNQPAKEHSPEAKKMLAGLRAAKDTPEEILTKMVSQVTEDEVDEVIGSPPYWQSEVPLHKESQGLVSGVMEHVWGTGPVMTDATGRPTDSAPINPYPKSPTPALAIDGGSVTDGAYRIGTAIADREGDSGLIEPISGLQSELNFFPDTSGYVAAKPLKVDGDFGPNTNNRLREVVRTRGAGPVLAAIAESPEREFLL
ncbi:MAG: hypothetical protein HQ514_13415 [Rhodospirillales bacterium]|nr:hypothetical protein [Rhodospirillales bacterium]